jgi:predicted lipid-binding transport protein (Tim44 family)
MKTWMSTAMSLALTATLAVASLGLPQQAEAKRLGGGKSQGMQRDMPARTAPDAAPARPAQPAPAATPGTPAQAGAPAAAPGKRSWLGPIAGLAAGLGIAALFSHLGMGAGLANFVMIALLAVGGFLLVRFLMARFGSGAARSPALAGAGAGAGSAAPASNPWRTEPALQRTSAAAPDSFPASASPAPLAAAEAVSAPAPTATARPAVTAAFVPASFDSEGFSRIAKMIFIRMQTANDAADLNDLRRFTTPEMFASIRLEIQERGGVGQTTDVVKVDAEVLDVAQEADRQIVSVRFRGEVVEEKGAAPTSFDEVWHLVKPTAAGDDNAAWAIAGIEQTA